MSRIAIIVYTIGVMLTSVWFSTNVYAQSARCDGVNPIRIVQRDYNADQLIIQRYLDCYRNYLDSQQNRYYLEFDIQINNNASGISALTLSPSNPDPNDRRDIVIRGLNIQGSTTSAGPVLTISGTQHKVILENSTITDQSSGVSLGSGILLQGGPHELRNVIAQRATESGGAGRVGINVQSVGAILSGVEVMQYDTGIQVAANNVNVLNRSHIHDNLFGISISNDIVGTKVERSRLYANGLSTTTPLRWLNAIRFGNQNYDFVYLVENNGQLAAVTVDPQNGVAFDGGRAVISVPEPPPPPSGQNLPRIVRSGGGSGGVGSVGVGGQPVDLSQQTGRSQQPASNSVRKVEFFLTDASDCGVINANSRHAAQACGLIENVNFPITGRLNDQIEFRIPEEHRGKRLVAVVSDPNVGVLGMTAPMAVSGDRVLVTGPSPIFIPTQPLGATGGDVVAATDPACQAGCDQAFIEQGHASTAEQRLKEGVGAEGGLVAAGGGGDSPRCSLSPHAPAANKATVWLGFWWIMTTLALLLFARPVCVNKYRNKQKLH